MGNQLAALQTFALAFLCVPHASGGDDFRRQYIRSRVDSQDLKIDTGLEIVVTAAFALAFPCAHSAC